MNNANKSPNSSQAFMKIEVQRGESLWQLAEKYQTTVDELVTLNQVKEPSQIREGQMLWVPNGETKKTSERPETKQTSAELEIRDVKEYSKGVLTILAHANEVGKAEEAENAKDDAEKLNTTEKLSYSPWWVNILRSIPVLATVYKQSNKTDESSDLPSAQPESKVQTYEIFVNKDPERSEKLSLGSIAGAKAENQKQAAENSVAEASSESQIHSRGLGRLVSKDEIELLSRVIYGEARGEDFLGQVAVGAVVLNRVHDPRFPKTIKGVIYESGAFTAVKDRQIHLDPNDQAYKAAEAALSGLDPTNGAIFYYNPRTATDKWIKSRTVIKRIGNHTFSI